MYLYHAHAVALGGAVERPVTQNMAGLAGCCLPPSGGTSSANHGKFDNGLVSFDSAQSDLTGSVETRNKQSVFVTGVSVVINKLNIRNMFTVDRVVLRIASEHVPQPPQPTPASGQLPLDEPSIITTGCHFDNLKIAGHPVKVEMAHDVFHKLPTYSECQKDWAKNCDKVTGKPDGNSLLYSTLMGRTLNPPFDPNVPSFDPNASDTPGHMKEIHQAFGLQSNSPSLRPNVLCSFVKKVNGINGAEIDNWGPIIRIPQFGTLYLGEVLISPGYRHVNMVRFQLGSPDSAGFSGPSGGSNGTTVP